MQKKSENVAHAEDGIRLKKLKNSRNLRNSPPTGFPPRHDYSQVYRGNRRVNLTLPKVCSDGNLTGLVNGCAIGQANSVKLRKGNPQKKARGACGPLGGGL